MPDSYTLREGYYGQFKQQSQIFRISDGDDGYDTEAEVAALIQQIAAGAKAPKAAALIWERTVQVQRAYAWGYADEMHPLLLPYPAFVAKTNTGNGGFFDGELIFRITDSAGVQNPEVERFDSAGLRSTLAYSDGTAANRYVERDKNKLSSPMPQSDELAVEGDRMQVWFRTQSAGKPGAACNEVYFEFPATVLNLGVR